MIRRDINGFPTLVTVPFWTALRWCFYSGIAGSIITIVVEHWR